MRIPRRWISALLLTGIVATQVAPPAAAQESEALAYYRQAKINWRQAEGQSLTIGLNKHPFTESLLPLIPQFRALTGINVEARSVLLVLVLGSVFTGAATSIQELVKDRVVYQRERAVGLSRGAFVAAKALLFGAVAALQGEVQELRTDLRRRENALSSRDDYFITVAP